MPRLKCFLDDLTRNGPTLDIKIEPVLDVQQLLRAEGRDIPSANLLGIIDTGASGTLVQSSVFAPLGMKPYTFAHLRTASTVQPLLRGIYRVRIVLTKNITFEMDVVEGPLIGQNVRCVVWRDILQHLLLTYDGPNSRFTLTLK